MVLGFSAGSTVKSFGIKTSVKRQQIFLKIFFVNQVVLYVIMLFILKVKNR